MPWLWFLRLGYAFCRVPSELVEPWWARACLKGFRWEE